MHVPADLLTNTDTVWFSATDTSSIVSHNNTSYLYREMKDENRRAKRFAVNDGTYLVLESYAPQICSIINIGAGGIAYTYFSNEEDATIESDTFDILVTGSGFCLENIPFRKVADFKAHDNTDAGSMEKRVACIEFTCLTEEQEMKIYNFIHNHIDKTIN